jgi:hypothetical protein
MWLPTEKAPRQPVAMPRPGMAHRSTGVRGDRWIESAPLAQIIHGDRTFAARYVWDGRCVRTSTIKDRMKYLDLSKAHRRVTGGRDRLARTLERGRRSAPCVRASSSWPCFHAALVGPQLWRDGGEFAQRLRTHAPPRARWPRPHNPSESLPYQRRRHAAAPRGTMPHAPPGTRCRIGALFPRKCLHLCDAKPLFGCSRAS